MKYKIIDILYICNTRQFQKQDTYFFAEYPRSKNGHDHDLVGDMN